MQKRGENCCASATDPMLIQAGEQEMVGPKRAYAGNRKNAPFSILPFCKKV